MGFSSLSVKTGREQCYCYRQAHIQHQEVHKEAKDTMKNKHKDLRIRDLEPFSLRAKVM